MGAGLHPLLIKRFYFLALAGKAGKQRSMSNENLQSIELKLHHWLHGLYKKFSPVLRIPGLNGD